MRKPSRRRPSTTLLTKALRSRPVSSPLGLRLAEAPASSSGRPGRGWGEIPASASESGPTGSALLPVGEDSTFFFDSLNQTVLFAKGSGIPNHDSALHPHGICMIHSWSLGAQWIGQNQT